MIVVGIQSVSSDAIVMLFDISFSGKTSGNGIRSTTAQSNPHTKKNDANGANCY